jgi:hypothetical protein
MPVSGKVLEDSIRLDRIRGIKRTLYIVQVALLLVLGFMVVYVGGAQLKPFYLPLDAFVAVMVVLLLVICVEGFFFRVLEIRFARSSSARHLMAKNSIKKALLIAVVSGVLATVLLVPPIIGGLEGVLETTDQVLPGEAEAFWTRDALALARTVELRVTAAQTVDVYLVTEKVFEQYGADLSQLYYYMLNKDSFTVTRGDVLTIEMPVKAHSLYYLVLNDMDSPGTSATVVSVKEVSQTFTGLVAILLMVFVVANVAWIAYLVPIERKYSEGSIYK